MPSDQISSDRSGRPVACGQAPCATASRW